MSEISEIPMTEQSPTTKISQQDLERSITNVARKAEMERGKSLEKPEPTLTPAAGDEINSADTTTLKRLKKLAFEKAGKALMFSVDKVPLAATAASFLVSIGCGNEVNPNIHATNTPEPTPASATLPENTSHNTDMLQPYTSQRPTEVSPTSTPAPDVSVPTMPDVPNIEQTTAVPSQPSEQKTVENKELIPYSPSISIIDAAPSTPTEGLIQKEFISNEDMIKQMLGDKYVSKEQIIQEFGQNYEDKWDEVVEKYPQAFLYRFADTYFKHGEKVAGVAEDTLERRGFRGTGFNIVPLQKIFDKESVKFIRDSSGNPGISLNFDPKPIIKALDGSPYRVISGSFEVGNVGLSQKTEKYTITKYIDSKGNTYSTNAPDGDMHETDEEGNEIPLTLLEGPKETKETSLLIEGAYAKEKAMENLPKLFEVCNAYPNKFFVFAGGNTGEDFREAMEKLKDKMPKNLLITAEWTKYDDGDHKYEGPPLYSYDGVFHGGVYGPGIYVNNSELGAPGGSSFSVPIISAEIDMLLSKGLSMEQAKEKILASSDTFTKELEDGTQATLKVFNPSKLQEK